MRHDRTGKAALLVNCVNPTCFAELVGAVPFGLAMHRRQHIVAGGIMPVIVRQVVAAQRTVVAHEKIMPLFADQIRVLLLRQVPQMMMRIDQRHRLRRVVPGPWMVVLSLCIGRAPMCI